MIDKIWKSGKEKKTVYFNMLTVLLLLVMSLCVLACNVIIIVYHAKINSVVITDISSELEAIRLVQICHTHISNTIIVRQYLAAILGFCSLASFFVAFLCQDAEKQNQSKKTNRGN